MAVEKKTDTRTAAELAILEKYGLRWAVLAAWCDDLVSRGVKVPKDLYDNLAEGRMKISSGCFSSCDVGCNLGAIEGQLVSLAASSGSETIADSVTMWLELLAQAMVATSATERLLNMPAVKFHYAECGFGPCGCDT